MTNTLKHVSEIVAKANDTFFNKYKKIDTLMGIMDKALRKQGMQADAITIDCVAQNKKIVFLLHDSAPDTVEVALGNKDGDIFSSSKYSLNDISEAAVFNIMVANFAS